MGWRDTITGGDSGASGSWRDSIQPAQDDESPVSAFADQVGRSVPIVGPLTVKAGHALAAGLGSVTPDSLLTPENQGKSFGELYDRLEQQDQSQQQQRWANHPVATALGDLTGASMLPVPGIEVGEGANLAQRVGGSLVNAGIQGQVVRADALARGADDDTADQASNIGAAAGLVGNVAGHLGSTLAGSRLASAGLGAGIGSALGGPAGGAVGAAAGAAAPSFAEALAPYAKPLAAAANRGGQALAVTHYLLSQQDPSYAKLFSEFKGTKELKDAANDYLGDNVVQPLASKGYPDLGAALATVPSVALDATMPSTPADYLPLMSIVHAGKYPLGELFTPEAAQEMRGSFDKIGGIVGKPNIVAMKFRGQAPQSDTWKIFDFNDQANDVRQVGQVGVDWGSNTPILHSIENTSGEDGGQHIPGLVQDFVTKLAERTGEVSSSMNFDPTDTPTGKRYLGAEMWEDKLPRVVEAPVPEGHDVFDGGDTVFRTLSPERFVDWLVANPEALDHMMINDPKLPSVFTNTMDDETFRKWLEKNHPEAAETTARAKTGTK